MLKVIVVVFFIFLLSLQKIITTLQFLLRDHHTLTHDSSIRSYLELRLFLYHSKSLDTTKAKAVQFSNVTLDIFILFYLFNLFYFLFIFIIIFFNFNILW